MTFIEPIFWLTLCIYHEARGEPIEGQVAVAHVVLNRAEHRGMSVKEVILEPWQFSWTNSKWPAIEDYAALERCLSSALKCLEERLSGETFQGADHYFADYISPPKWARDMTKITQIGHHIFFKS